MRQKFYSIVGAAVLLLGFSININEVGKISFGVGEAKSQICAVAPSCESLGYTQSSSDCNGALKFLKCPLDQNKMFCLSAGEIPGGDTKIGDILYSDMTTNSEYFISKTPIGVVFDTINRYAVSLSETEDEWSWLNNKDIPELSNGFSDAVDGKANTQIIIAHGETVSTRYNAAEYCNNYTTKGTTAGQWFLPSIKQLSLLNANITAVNITLQKLSDTLITQSQYWSSNEHSTNSAFHFFINNHGANHSTKDRSEHKIRPILSF